MKKKERERESRTKRSGMSRTLKTSTGGEVEEACPCSMDKRVSDNLVTTAIANNCQ